MFARAFAFPYSEGGLGSVQFCRRPDIYLSSFVMNKAGWKQVISGLKCHETPVPHTKHYKNRMVFAGVIQKIKSWTFLRHSVQELTPRFAGAAIRTKERSCKVLARVPAIIYRRLNSESSSGLVQFNLSQFVAVQEIGNNDTTSGIVCLQLMSIHCGMADQSDIMWMSFLPLIQTEYII